jgi:K+-transporting ATPase ATPase C chain
MPIFRPCLVLFACLALISGVVYPLVITLVAQVAFPVQAEGSLVRQDGRIVGSRLIAQPCRDPGLFWPRPSAVAWNAAGSGGANLAPVSAPQCDAWRAQAATLRTAGIGGILPADLVTASGSGLDPHLSPAAIRAQIPRVAAARGLPVAAVHALADRFTEPPWWGVVGAARVNVLELNQALLTMAGGGP